MSPLNVKELVNLWFDYMFTRVTNIADGYTFIEYIMQRFGEKKCFLSGRSQDQK